VAARYQQSGVGDPSGKLVGKAALKTYFAEALQEVTDLRLDLQVLPTAHCCQALSAVVNATRIALQMCRASAAASISPVQRLTGVTLLQE